MGNSHQHSNLHVTNRVGVVVAQRHADVKLLAYQNKSINNGASYATQGNSQRPQSTWDAPS